LILQPKLTRHRTPNSTHSKHICASAGRRRRLGVKVI
jgi:hypothetical protein